MTIPRRRTSLLIGVALVLLTFPGILFGSGVMAQPDDLSAVVDRLIAQGVPVISSASAEDQVEITLQSASTTEMGTPDDPLLISRVERELVLAKSRGFDIQSLKLTVMNSQKEVLATGWVPLDQTVDLSWLQPAPLDERATEISIWDQITKEVPLAGVSLDTLAMGREADGSRVLTLELSARDEKVANQSWAGFMIRLYRIVNDTNASDQAQISLVRVDLSDDAGKPLFRYVYDAQRDSQSWWQAPDMTTDWFETPS